jgi:hypothetical protein
MTDSEIIKIISENSLTVRCLPHVVINNRSYQEGDEKKKYVNSEGVPSTSKRTVITQKFDLEYFKRVKPQPWDESSPEKRYERFLKAFPTGERKFLREEREVKRGGWWYVKETPNTSSNVLFSSKYDISFPTLGEAIKAYLEKKEEDKISKDYEKG